MSAPDEWDTWASAVVTREYLASRGAHPAQVYAMNASLDRLERSMVAVVAAHERVERAEREVGRLAAARPKYHERVARRERRNRATLAAVCAVCVLGALVVVASCAPANAAPPAPTITEWTQVVARPGLTPTHVGACVADIDTTTAAELVKERNAAENEYGALPQAGSVYDVPTETINCKGVTG